MTAYFDNVSSELDTVIGSSCISEEELLTQVGLIESKVVQDVLLITGDREFPDDLRQTILTHIAVYGIYNPAALPPMEKTVQRVLALRDSMLLRKLHDDFHEVGSRRIKTRFGLLGDDPRQILNQRTNWELEHFSSLRHGQLWAMLPDKLSFEG